MQKEPLEECYWFKSKDVIIDRGVVIHCPIPVLLGMSAPEAVAYVSERYANFEEDIRKDVYSKRGVVLAELLRTHRSIVSDLESMLEGSRK